jgi:PAS domain S-box-containing protein
MGAMQDREQVDEHEMVTPPPPQLRAKAEAQLAKIAPVEASASDPMELLHELRVHQVELEMQNEELRRAQVALEESRDRYVDLYEFAPVGYLTLSDKGLILQANLTAATLLGIERGRLLQRRFSMLVAAEDQDRFHGLFVAALQHKQGQPCELMLKRDDGSRFPAHLDCQCATRAGEGPVARIALTDISELRRAENAIRDLNRTLTASNQELESFSYSVAHDLRTPLRAMTGFSEALAEEYADKLDENGRHYLARIHAAGERMGQLIDDLIGLARIGREKPHRVEVNLSAMAETILAELQEPQPQRGATWSVAPRMLVRADRVLVKILLENLLRNAWKFTAERAEARIEFGQAPVAGETAFYVRDNGAGFDMAFADKLFKPFQRLHHAERFEGNGIGLAIVQRIVQRHGGRIWAESVSGQGTTLWFTL